MQIELYLVPPGNADFRKTLIQKATEELEGPDYSKILYLAPTRQLVTRWQKDFQHFGGGCYIPPRASTLRELSKRLYTQSGGLLLNKRLVPIAVSGVSGHGLGYAAIVSDFIREMKNHFPGEDAEALRLRFEGIFAELYTPEEVSKRVCEAIEIFGRYNEALSSAEAADEEDAIAFAASAAGRQSGPHVLVLDGFYELTPAEDLFVRALISKARKTLISIPISETSDDLSYCYCRSITEHFGVEPTTLPSRERHSGMKYVASKSREEEVEAMARHIKSQFVSGGLKELDSVYVAFPKTSEYRELLARVFRRYGIPFSPEPEPSGHYGDLLSLLDSVSDGYPRLATARFLASPHFEGIPESLRRAVPAIALEAGGITGKDSWLKAFESCGLEKEGREIFRRVSSLSIPLNLGSFASLIEALLHVLKRLGFTSGQEHDDYEDVLRGLCTLDSIPGAKPTSLRSLAESLRAYLDLSGNKKNEVPGVHVAPLRELRGLDPEVLYMGGLKDGDLPARPEVDFLLPDSVRTRLGLVDMHRYMRLQGYIFGRLAATAGDLRLSYPAMEDNKLFLPSLFLRGGEEVKEKLYGDFSPEEAMTRRRGRPLSADISEIEGVKGRAKGDSPIRVTDIDAYRACPRRFFIERVMGLEPPEIREYEIEPKTIGSVAHEVMEKLVGPPLEGFEAFSRRAEKVLAEVLEKWPLDEYFKDLIRESFLTVLPDIYSLEEALASEGYRIEMTEYPLRGEPLPGIKLKGKIDRVDMKNGGAALVLDYKTGAAELSSASTVKRGTTLQPFIYAAMLKADGISPESVGYYSLKDIRISRVPKDKDLKDGLTLDYFIESSLLYLDSTVYSMRLGDYMAHPLSDAHCRRCHERPYCPYIQGDAK